jgi:PIN domain nuclease of toxin-antitoxin system
LRWRKISTIPCPNFDCRTPFGSDAIASTRLPGDFHRDPADRIIVALSRRTGAALVTADKLIRDYPHGVTVW